MILFNISLRLPRPGSKPGIFLFFIYFLALYHWAIGNCEFQLNRKISFIYETKWDEISLKPKVKGRENFRQIPWTFVKVLANIWPTFVRFYGINESWQKSACIWQILQVSLAIFSINLSDFYQNRWNITKFNKK
jgi:hypothetical protein